MKTVRNVAILAGVLGMATMSNAALTNMNWWRMGEDPIITPTGFSTAAAVDGAEADWIDLNPASTPFPAAPTSVALRVRQQGVVGGATYSTDVPSDPKAAGSTFSLDLPNTAGQAINITGTASATRNTSFGTPATNFGGEIWFKPDTLDTNLQTLFFIGSSSAILPVRITATAEGVPQVVIATKNNGPFTWTNPVGGLTVGQWNHVAIILEDSDADLVNGGGSVKLYVNGQLEPTSQTLTAALASTDNNYYVGASTTGTAGQFGNFFDGKVDEARVFTFAAGAFDPNTDLMVTVPEPTMLGLAGLVGLGLLRRRRA